MRYVPICTRCNTVYNLSGYHGYAAVVATYATLILRSPVLTKSAVRRTTAEFTLTRLALGTTKSNVANIRMEIARLIAVAVNSAKLVLEVIDARKILSWSCAVARLAISKTTR